MMLVSSNGKFCDCCGVCADSAKCINLVDSKLKCKDKVLAADANSMAKHLWVKGNLPMHCICVVCKDDVDYHAEPGLDGYRCCWCQRTTHTGCLPNVNSSEICDFGQFKAMIIQPACLRTTKSGHSGKLKLTEIVPPEGVAEWKPLFVIGKYLI